MNATLVPCMSSAVGIRRPGVTASRRHTVTLSVRCSAKAKAEADASTASRSRRRGVLTLGVAAALAISRGLAAEAIDIVPVSPDVVEGLNRRDEAAAYKCTGGMMDCDADRREYAKQQIENFKKRGTPEYQQACKREDSCREPPKDLGEATMRMLSDIGNAELGMSSETKMQKMGVDVERPNVIAMP